MWGSKGGSGLTYPGSLGIHVLSHEGTAFVVLQKLIAVAVAVAIGTVYWKKLKNLPHEQQSMESFPSSPLLSGNSSVSSMTSLSSLPTLSSLSISKESLLLGTPIEAPKEQKRCLFGDCKKKLAFSDFACRCGTRFCATHRAAEEHKCTHDWKAEGKKTLGTQLGSCINAKLERI